MRINARLDDNYFSAKLRQKGEAAWEKNQKILEMVGGIAAGDGNLSEIYKESISQGLKEKHDYSG